MASSSSTARKYDVFLNFRGPDTRYVFTSYLYEALRSSGINAFIDAKLERGEEISAALLQEIECSSISVVIFSQNYAFSPYCLDELVKIIECKESTGQVILPVFYMVDPTDIEEQRGSFEKAFAEHEAKFKGEKDKVKKWKSALRGAVNLSGWHITDDKLGAEHITKIVSTISKRLSEEKKQTLKRNLQELQAMEADLNSRLQSAKSFSSERQKNEVGIWLSNVGRIKNEAQSMQRQLEKSGWTMQFGVLAERMIEEVRGLIDQKGGLEGALVTDAPQTNEEALPTKSLVGQNFQSNMDLILEWLLSDEVSSIGIYGMGGVGKTTLISHIHNKILENPSNFTHVYWVTVSQDFTVYKLQSLIAKTIKIDLGEEEDVRKRAARLSKELNRRHKFVLILDDLWNHFDLKEVGVPIGRNGCKLIVTTRSIEVCRRINCQRMKKVEPLNREEAWELFVKTLGCELSPNVEMIAKFIVRKCSGLPLAVVTMAGSMRGVDDLHEWKNALIEIRKSILRPEDMGEVVFPILRYSYARLKDPTLQQCLLYCALFPEDFWIEKRRLIEYLIVEGMINEERETVQEKLEKGYTMLNKLENVCLLEQGYGGCRVKMHDLIRDMAIQIMKECQPSTVEAGQQLRHVADEKYWREDIVRASLMKNDIIEIPPNFSPSCPNLSTLFLSENYKLLSIGDSFFDQLQGLKVVDISHTNFEKLPKSFFVLKNLTAFVLRGSKIKHIPKLANLKSMELLDLSFNRGIKKLPKGLELLSNLWKLDLLYGDIMEFPGGILPKISRLQYLGYNRASKNAEELGGLRRLGTLYWCFPSLEDMMTFLRLLPTDGIEYFLCVGKQFDNYQVVDGAYHQIRIERCTMTTDLRELHFQIDTLSLINVSFVNGRGLCLRNPIGLKSLRIINCDGIEHLFSLSTSPSIFQSLEKLAVSGIKSLKMLVLQPPQSTICFSLKELAIYNCPVLKKLLPHCLLENLQNLEKIDVIECRELEEMISVEENSQILPLSLPNLRELNLSTLPKLKSICSQQIKCERLQSILIFKCEKVENISISLPLPYLRAVKINPKNWWESVKWGEPHQKDALPYTEDHWGRPGSEVQTRFPHFNPGEIYDRIPKISFI